MSGLQDFEAGESRDKELRRELAQLHARFQEVTARLGQYLMQYHIKNDSVCRCEWCSIPTSWSLRYGPDPAPLGFWCNLC